MTKSGGSTPEDNGKQPGDDEARAPGQGQKRSGPISPEMRLSIEEACREAIASGVGTRNSVARAFEVSPRTVTRICQTAQPPILWDRSQTKAAVEAAVVDAKARRMAISETILDRAQDILTRMVSPHEVIGWYQGMASTHQIDQPLSGDVKNYAIALGILMDKHAMLTRFDSDDRDLSSVDQWLEHMLTGEQP